MPREWCQRLEDVLVAISRIDSFTHDHDLASSTSDRQALDAVAYDVLVVGETAVRAPESIATAHPEIPWMKMRANRNVVAHQYFEVRPEILWRTAMEELPQLVLPLRRLLDSGQDA